MAARKLQAQQPATKSRGALPCRDNPPRRAYAEAQGAGPAGCVAHASAFRQQGTSCKRSRHKICLLKAWRMRDARTLGAC